MEIIPESEWEVLFKELVKSKGTAMIMGSTDSGKTTLARYLIHNLISEEIKVCLVDSDVGQSSLCLPGTISMKVFCNEKDLEDFTFERMCFIGSVNPGKKISSIIDGAKRMSDICRELSDISLMDTSGLIFGELGKALKIGKIKAVKPGFLFALQRHDELEHILELVKDIHIHRIKVSHMAKARNREVRIRYRKKKLDDYFNQSDVTEFLLHIHEASFFYNNRTFSLKEGLFQDGTLIGLNHDEDTIALGIIDYMNDTSITFRSPIQSIKTINKVVFGDITI